MKRIIGLTLLICCVLCTVSTTVGAVSLYDDLYSKRQEYLLQKYGDEVYSISGTWGEDYYSFPYVDGCRLTVLLYTEAAKELTFVKHEHIDGLQNGLSVTSDWFFGMENSRAIYHLTSPELDEVTKDCESYRGVEIRSQLKACIEYFDISKDELIAANQKMQENPNSIRELFPFLSDAEFEAAKKENGMFCIEPLADFMIEALYMDDTEMAYNLLRKPYAVYVKEMDRMITSREIDESTLDVNDLSYCDLTLDAMGEFVDFCEKVQGIDSGKIALLRSAREAQLAAAKTGDSAVSALWVIALSLPALTVVAVKRKRRI